MLDLEGTLDIILFKPLCKGVIKDRHIKGHFTDEEIQAQKGEVTSLMPQREQVENQRRIQKLQCQQKLKKEGTSVHHRKEIEDKQLKNCPWIWQEGDHW